jgi:uncharacterized protein YcfJ
MFVVQHAPDGLVPQAARQMGAGQESVVRTDQAPGKTIPVRDGRLDLSSLTARD